ncbi:MAG: efflux RND transporter periplasmic adaptor subunit [Bacteroidales bacterium]|nr:efflux RND transporter periplasmic adaptor subunit [Bacteroidales bacterium]
MKTRIRIITSFVFFGLIVFSCKPEKNNHKTTEIVPVKVYKVQNQTILYPIRCSGMLSAQLQSKLSFKTGGVIEKIFVKEGEKVRKGEIMARLNLSEIDAGVKMATSGYEKAQRDFERAQNLYNDSVATLEQYQNAKTALQVAQSNFEIARFNKAYSVISAPSSGKVLKKLAEESEVIGAGHPVFLFASTESSWIVKTSVTDKDIVHIKMGDSAHINFDAYPNEIFKAKVSETGTMADPYTGTYEIELTMLHNPEKMTSGFIAKAEIYPSYSKILPVVPHNALIEGNELTAYVYVLKDSIPVRTKITIDKIMDEGLAVKSGLKEGDVVITEGLHYINNGCKLKIED